MKDSIRINILEPVPIVRTLVLFLLKKNPNSSGYKLINLVKEFTTNQVSLKTGTLYPELKSMVDEGLLDQEEQVTGKRKAYLYCLTRKGEEELAKLINAIKTKEKSFARSISRRIFQHAKKQDHLIERISKSLSREITINFADGSIC